jgi:hypothetical protein
VAATARGVHDIHATGTAAVQDHPRLEGFDSAALGITQEIGGGAGQRLVTFLGNHRSQTGLNLGFHQQGGLIIAEIAQPGQHRRQPGDVAQLAGPALAVEVQHVARRNGLAGPGPRHAWPPCARVPAE